jgi:hypothetical protein
MRIRTKYEVGLEWFGLVQDCLGMVVSIFGIWNFKILEF